MANEDHDLDLDDDLDDDLDLPDLDFDDPESDPSDRSPVDRASRGFADGIKQSAISRSTQKKLLDNALPKGYGSAYQGVTDAADAAEDLYDTAKDRLRPAAKDAKKIGRKVREKASPYIPKWLDDKLDSWTKEDPDDSRGEAYDPQENEIQTTLGEIFQTQQEQKAQDDVEEKTEKQTDRALEDARYLDNKSQLERIQEAIGRVVGYQEDIASKFQKKSLELQFRQYFVAKDQYSLLKEYAEESGQSLVDIRKNTALPEFLKMRGSERVREMLRDKTLGKIGDSLYGFSQDFAGNLFENIKGQVSSFTQSVADNITDTAEAMEMAGDAGDPLDLLGSVAGSEGGNWAAGKIGKLIGRFTKDNDTLARVGADLEYLTQGGTDRAAQSLAGNLDSRIKSLREEIDRKEMEDEKVTIREKGELALLERVAEMIPRYTEEGRFGMSSDMLAEEVSTYTELTDKTITETIPNLLSEILREAEMIRTGSNDAERQIYDFDKGQVVRESQLQDDIRQKIVDSGDVSGLTDKVNKVVDLLDGEGKLDNETRAKLADQIEKDVFQNKAFTIENYANADNLDMLSSDEADKVTQLINSQYMEDGKFKKDRKASEIRKDASKVYSDAKRGVPNYKEVIARSASAYGSGVLERAGLSEYTGKDGLHETRSETVRDIFKDLDVDNRVARNEVQGSQRNVLDDISNADVGSSEPVYAPQPEVDVSRWDKLMDSAKQWVEPYLQVLWETMDESKAFIEGIYDFLIERFDGDPPDGSGGGTPPPGGSPWDRPTWTGPSGSSPWDRAVGSFKSMVTSPWDRDVGQPQPNVGFSESTYNPNSEGSMGEKLGTMAGNLFSKAKDKTEGLRSKASEYGNRALGEVESTYRRYRSSESVLDELKGDASRLTDSAKGKWDQARADLSERYEGSKLQGYVGKARSKFDEVSSDVNEFLLDNGIDVVKLAEDGEAYIQGLYQDAQAKGQPYVEELEKRLGALSDFSSEALEILSDKDARGEIYQDAKDKALDSLNTAKENAVNLSESIYDRMQTEEGRRELARRAGFVKDDLVSGISDRFDDIKGRVESSDIYTKFSPKVDDLSTRYGDLRKRVEQSETFTKFKPKLDEAKGRFDDARASMQDSFSDLKENAGSKVEQLRSYLTEHFGNSNGEVDEVVGQLDDSDISPDKVDELAGTARFRASFNRLLNNAKSRFFGGGGDEPPTGELPHPNDSEPSSGGRYSATDEPFRPWLDELKQHLDVKTEMLIRAIAAQDNRGVLGKTFDTLRSGAASVGSNLMGYYGKTFSGIGSLFKGAGQGAGNLLGGLFNKREKQSGSSAVADIYLEGVEEPIILARDLKRGLYSDLESGDPIHSFDDIDGAVINSDGDVVITSEDVEQGKLYVLSGKETRPIADFLKGGASLLGKGAKGLFGGYWNAARSIQSGIFTAVKKVGGFLPGLLFGKEKEKSAKDVYVKGETEPRLRAVIMKTGGYLSAETEEPIRTIQDIDGEVLDLDGNVVLSHEDIKKGLVDSRGKPLDLSTGKSNGLVQHAMNLTRKGLDMTVGLTKGVFKASKSVVKGIGGAVGGLFGGMFGGKLKGENAEKLLSDSEQQTQLLTEIRDLINERVNPPDKFFDQDDDGLRDGGWRSKLYGDKSKDDAEGKDGKDKGEFADKGNSILSKLGGLFGLGGGDDGDDGDDYSYVDVGGDGDDKDKKNNKNKNNRKPKTKLGKMWQGVKNIGSKAGRFLGLGSVAGGLKTAGSFLWNNVIRSAGSWAVRGLWMLGSAAVSILGAPVALTIGAVAAVGAGAYFLYKWADQADLDDVNRARYTQYGADLENDEHVGMMYKLENFLQDYVVMPKGEQPKLEGVDPEDLLDELDLDPEEDEEQIERLYTWMNERFKPVYLSWIAAGQPYMEDFDVEDMEDQLEVKEKIQVLKASKFEDGPESPYRKTTSPYKEGSSVVGFSQVDRVYNEVMELLKSQLDEDEQDTVDDSSPATEEKEDTTHTKEELMAMTPAERLRASASRQDNPRIKRKMLDAANRLEKRQGSKGTTLAGMAIAANGEGPIELQLQEGQVAELPDASLVNDAVGKTRMVTYGLQSTDETEKVQHLLELERVVKPMMQISNGKATFKGSRVKLFNEYASMFGRDPESDKDRTIWTEWFTKRFIPVLATYMSKMSAMKGSFYSPMSLKGQGPYEVASSMRSAVNGSQMSVWTVFAPPWPDYKLSDNSAQVREFLNELLTRKDQSSQADVQKSRPDFGKDETEELGRLGGQKADGYQTDAALFADFESPGSKPNEPNDTQGDTQRVEGDQESDGGLDPRGAADRLRAAAERQTNPRAKQMMLRKANELERGVYGSQYAKPTAVDDERDERAAVARQVLDRDARRQERSVAAAAAQNQVHNTKLTENTNRMVSILNQSVGVQKTMVDQLSQISSYLRDSTGAAKKDESQSKDKKDNKPKQRQNTTGNGDVKPAVNMNR
ncbi:MAG: hypothetical protein CL582_14250 [Alteromonadaceae bacterium]|nr:hypothetical protein [Alteromonadaceae bacterium]